VSTGRVFDKIVNPDETHEIEGIIAEGEYYGMQTFDQSLLKLYQRGEYAEALKREEERCRMRLVLVRLVAADDGLEQMLDRDSVECEVDGRATLGGNDPEAMTSVSELVEHDVHPVADGDRVVQRLVVGAIDAHELVDACGVEGLHLRLEPRPADGGQELGLGVVAAEHGLRGMAHRREDDRAGVDDSAVEIEQDDREAHPA